MTDKSDKPKIDFEAILERMKALELPTFDLIVGIARGGIVPASLLAYRIGCDLRILSINYRDGENRPRYEEPRLLGEFKWQAGTGGRSVLLVDDVSVTGKTFETARRQLEGCRVTTFALKGKADYVLFPEIEGCIRWPWLELDAMEGKR